MEVISKQGDPDLAEVFVARFRNDDRLLAEFVDARDPTLPLSEKWVIIVSTQFGCPLGCPMCDAGGRFEGNLGCGEMIAQIDHVVAKHPKERMQTSKFKVQFARMGEPALNPEVLDALRLLPKRYDAPGLIPCVATTAPRAGTAWLDELLYLRHDRYSNRPFQLQFSVNSTDEAVRDFMMPAPKLKLGEIAEYVEKFHVAGQRKASLNFALTQGFSIDPDVIAMHFDPKSVCIKLTPLNPTFRSAEHGMESAMKDLTSPEVDATVRKFKTLGFDVIVSIGDLRENAIGSNCGMAVARIAKNPDH